MQVLLSGRVPPGRVPLGAVPEEHPLEAPGGTAQVPEDRARQQLRLHHSYHHHHHHHNDDNDNDYEDDDDDDDPDALRGKVPHHALFLHQTVHLLPSRRNQVDVLVHANRGVCLLRNTY